MFVEMLPTLAEPPLFHDSVTVARDTESREKELS